MSRRILRTSIIGVMLAVATWLPASANAQPHAQAARSAPAAQAGILPPPGPWYGSTYNQWSAAWWQYVAAQPTSSNPTLDRSGAKCAVGQSGPVFFLVGTSPTGSSGSVTRNACMVPAGKALFFPLVNAFAFHVQCTGQNANICDDDTNPQQLWKDQLVPIFNYTATTNLHASIDGVQVGNLDPATTPYRACVGPFTPCSPSSFSVTLPADNLFSGFGVPAGTYSPTVADGFYLLLAPLASGRHTITFGGTTSGGFTENITYNLMVSP